VEHRYPAGTLDTKEQERAHKQATVEKLHLERLSQRAIARTTGMSRMMVAAGGTYLDPALAAMSSPAMCKCRVQQAHC
jgi:hypothetical protein